MIEYRLYNLDLFDNLDLFEEAEGELITLYVQNLPLKADHIKTLVNICPGGGFWRGNLAIVSKFINFMNNLGSTGLSSVLSPYKFNDWFPILPGISKKNKIIMKYCATNLIYTHNPKGAAEIETITKNRALCLQIYNIQAINDYGFLRQTISDSFHLNFLSQVKTEV